MGIVNVGEVTRKFTNDLGLIPTESPVPNHSTDFIQPTYDFANAKFCDIIASTGITNSTSGTVFTTPTDRDFFLTSVSLSMIKDVTATSTVTNVTAVVNGATVTLISIKGISLTAQFDSTSNNYSVPIKLDRGTTILVTNSTNVANNAANAQIAGFTKQVF